ncbi:MAG: type II toxin-antitoxin system VapC family toxin [Candidatus Hydrothermarchaeaceae archaeon]
MENGEKIVVDASVVAKWFLREVHSEKADAMRLDYVNGLVDLAAPDLLPYEVLNALRYNQDFGKADLEKIADSIKGYQLHLVPIKRRSVGLAYEYGISVYDASYVALANELGVELYTADSKLIRRLDGFISAKHLSEYGPKSPR